MEISRIRGGWKIAPLVVALLAAYWLHRKLWQPLKMATDKERFIQAIAIQFKEPRLCQKIDFYSEGRDMWGGMTPAPPGYQITYLQSDCYLFLAAELHDFSLCDKVRPLRNGLKDGSRITPGYCRMVPQRGISHVPDPYTVVAIMREIGYDEPEIREFQYRTHYSGPIRDTYERLLKEDQFAAHLAAAPGFGEPDEIGRKRPANDLEYLYEMVANDTNNSTLCGKISPNAISDRPTSKNYPLRFQCYSNIALNKLDPGECQKLPVHAYLQSAEGKLNPAESCLQNVRAIRRNSNPRCRWGPEFPPTFASFNKALQAVGYKVVFPEPTYSDYESFILDLATNPTADPAARAQFIARVDSASLR